MRSLLAAVQRLERRRGLLGLAKLGNVALAILWGFVVTYVFVRLLPLADFRAFLLLVAFANFTVSAEFGFSTIIYARLRRHLLTGEGGFRSEELGVLLVFMLVVVVLGVLLLLGAMAAGFIVTSQPGLFIAFYGVAAMNLVALLAKRTLAALDHNLWWEGLDLLRRVAGVLLLAAALAGLPLMTSVLAQLTISAMCVLAGFVTAHRVLALPPRHWFALRVGGGHVRAHYMGDIGRTVALTVSDIAAYNAPYFTIAAATHDVRPLLLFDFLFKISRALSAVIRALTETAMPGITRALHGGEDARLTGQVRRLLGRSVLVALLLGAGVIAGGGALSAEMFDGHAVLTQGELALVALVLVGLVPICVSVYLQTGLARFSPLLLPSFGLLVGSLLSAPLAAWLAERTGQTFALCFAATYASVFLALGTIHLRLAGRIAP